MQNTLYTLDLDYGDTHHLKLVFDTKLQILL